MYRQEGRGGRRAGSGRAALVRIFVRLQTRKDTYICRRACTHTYLGPCTTARGRRAEERKKEKAKEILKQRFKCPCIRVLNKAGRPSYRPSVDEASGAKTAGMGTIDECSGTADCTERCPSLCTLSPHADLRGSERHGYIETTRKNCLRPPLFFHNTKSRRISCMSAQSGSATEGHVA